MECIILKTALDFRKSPDYSTKIIFPMKKPLEEEEVV